jgi:DNA-3-methyladenine glycosylase I
MSSGLIEGPDGRLRCAWSGSEPLYLGYHDHEWGRPVTDDTRLFEKLSLEGFQSGLSWLTILRKRDNFRAAFRGFDIKTVASFTARDVNRLLGDTGIVRHRGKIESTINNARRALEVRLEFGSLARFYWSFEPDATERPGHSDWATLKTLTQTDASRRLAKELKKRGFSFVGPTTAYAFMQAMGLVNDHVEMCAFHAQVEKERHRFRRPGPGG